MFRSLRNRLIFSHILPLLVIIPLMGIAMAYLLETRLLLPMIYSNLSDDATLIAEVARAVPEIWQSTTNAQIFVQGADPYLAGRLTLTDPYGRVLASTDLYNIELNGEIVDLPDLANARRGDTVQMQNGRLAEVFTPVVGSDGQMFGVVRLSTKRVTIPEEIYQLRFLLVAILFLAILAGVGLGSYLAINISQPVQRVTQAIHTLAQGDMQTRLFESGTEEMRTLVRAVNTLVERLQSMEQARHQLLANLVHELGRPLGALRSAIRALQKGADRDPKLSKDLLNGMDEETALLKRLLDDLAGLYDQVLGSLELNRKTLILQEWLPKILIPWEIAAKEKRLTWQLNIPDDRLIFQADSDRLAQAIGNLCSNAIKFTQKGGEVTISAGVDEDQLWIRVSDNGLGIQPQDLENIFLPFYRGNQNRRIIQGMGLGLTIAHEIVLAHEGHIKVQSEPGTGSIFTIWLPV